MLESRKNDKKLDEQLSTISSESEAIMDHWPFPDRDTTQFPYLNSEGNFEMKPHLAGFLQLDGIGWQDYDTQLEKSALQVEHSRLRTYRKMYERLGVLYQKAGKIRLGTLGLSMREINEVPLSERENAIYNLKRLAISILSRYQLTNPAENEHRKMPESCDVFPFLCLWKAMYYLDKKIHYEEVNRVILRVMTMADLEVAIDKVKKARSYLGSYETQDESTLNKMLGLPVCVDQPQSRIAALFSLASWGWLLTDHGENEKGFRVLTEEFLPQIEKILDNPPKYYTALNKDDWFSYYSAWAGLGTPIDTHVKIFKTNWLAAYKNQPIAVTEHANIELAASQGGYGRRQLYELVQNGADALINMPGGKINILLTNQALYCANEGEPIDIYGIDSIFTSHISAKRGPEIGRYGLGFKAVLGVTSSPRFYSRSGSFAFDATRSKELIEKVVPNAKKYPILRMGLSIDPRDARLKDSNLNDLMLWADSIVKLPRNKPNTDWLSEDMVNFPAQFLLFCPHVGKLIFEDRTSGITREIKISKDDNTVLLEEGGKQSYWKVFEVKHAPSEAARRDGGELSNREYIPVAWAVPIQGGITFDIKSPGQFWAFFPTNNPAKLRGIINAAWKTNEDRQNLLKGPFNDEIIDVCAKLVANNISKLVNPLDPSNYLEMLPGRLDEDLGWADSRLNRKIYDELSNTPSLPNMDGILCLPLKIYLHPSGMPSNALKAWKSFSEHPVEWCHHSVDTTTRRARAERLLELKGKKPASVQQWLESLVVKTSPEASLAALITALKIAEDCSPTIKSLVSQSRILLDQGGILETLDSDSIFISNGNTPSNSKIKLVHSYISDSDEGKKALAAFGIVELNASSELQVFLANRDINSFQNSDWNTFWSFVNKISFEQGRDVIKKYINDDYVSKVKVRTLDGGFHPINQTLLPGSIVPNDGSRDTSVTVDLEYHKKVKPLLVELGAVEVPHEDGSSRSEIWFKKYITTEKERFRQFLTPSVYSQQIDYFDFNRNSTVGPLLLLSRLSDEGREKFTRVVADIGVKEPAWVLKHTKKPNDYPNLSCDPPSKWIAKQEGRLETSLGIKPVSECVGPDFHDWQKVFAVTQSTLEIADYLDVPLTLQALKPNHWNTACINIEALNDVEYAGKFYSMACNYLPKPTKIICKLNNKYTLLEPEKVFVLKEAHLCKIYESVELPYIMVQDHINSEVLIEKWGLQTGDSSFKIEIKSIPSGPEIPIIDRFLGLSAKLGHDQESMRLVPCTSIFIEINSINGKQKREYSCMPQGNLIYFIDNLSNADLLKELVLILNISLTEEEYQDILENRAFEEQRQRAQKIGGLDDPAAKLLEAVGDSAIYNKLPSGLIEAAKNKYPDFETNKLHIAKLALGVYGIDVLHTFREELNSAGLGPPIQWAGGNNARRFVKLLGFPEEYAGFSESRREAVLEVDGPPHLPELHDFQKTVVNRIRNLIKAGKDMRGLLSLPTGAGKTRIAVQALVESIREEKFSGPILWVAQSDELCEQAVQSWSEVWRALGPQKQLHINRLWSVNEADYYSEGLQVVVATIDKLQGCVKDRLYDWLSNPSCVIIDEAHGATTVEYTALLNWLGLNRGKDIRPLVGLTATPFRGGKDSTADLVRRFYAKRLDDGILGADPYAAYAALQDMEVLSRVDHELLGGATITDLSDDELAQLNKMRSLPKSVEDRIGSNVSRNEILLNSISKLDKDWPVLLFAASVDHASTMAALLNSEGISAAAISSGTDPGARKYYIEKFRHRELRVLTNYAVLTAGFDAPATRAIYVARPVFSPGLYQQMIGRGLRGPKNGGKNRCLIVNVDDNFVQYGEKLAFTEFEGLWKSMDGNAKEN